jgi:flavin-dependent dehydrogenase
VHSSFRINELIAFYDPAIDSGYGWIFPMGMNTYNVGWISFYNDIHSIKPNLSKTFYKFAESFPHAKKLFKSGNMISILQGASLRWGLNGAIPIFPKNVLNIGEIIGSTLPITGEGISYAMNTGERAAMAVHDALVSDNMNKLEQYSNWIDAELRPKQAEKLKRWVRFCKAYKNN